MLKREHIAYKRNDKLFTIKSMTIRKFYSICKRLKENCVVTIGKDLISRGISYVSEDKHDPLTATTMIYKPGTSLHSVGICQTIGRITGCAMPSLKRRLYAPKDVIDTYNAYNRNQEAYIANITNVLESKGDAKLTKDVVAEMTFEKFKRNIDRSKLKLKMNMLKDDDQFVAGDDESTMKRLIDMWWNADTIIGKILTFVYKHKNGVGERELKDFIMNSGSTNIDGMYKHMVSNGKEYKYIFERNDKNITNLKPESRKLINELN